MSINLQSVNFGSKLRHSTRQSRAAEGMRTQTSVVSASQSRTMPLTRATATSDAIGRESSQPALAATPWTRLEEPLAWAGPDTDAASGDATADLTPGFKVHSALADTESLKRKEVLETLGECDVDLLDLQTMLLSDGSVTRHLQLITGNQIKADCFDMSTLPPDQEGLPGSVKRLRGPIVQRQVLLKERRPHIASAGNGSGEEPLGPPLVYATSWWNAAAAERHLGEQRDRPIGVSLRGLELRREIASVFHGNSTVLERDLGAEGPFWGREYTLWKGGEPLTVIYEVFSPRLQHYFGTCQL